LTDNPESGYLRRRGIGENDPSTVANAAENNWSVQTAVLCSGGRPRRRFVTDLLGLAWEDAYDAAILVSADKDFIPAVEYLQAKNFKIINAAWRGIGNELAAICWASFEIDTLISKLAR